MTCFVMLQIFIFVSDGELEPDVHNLGNHRNRAVLARLDWKNFGRLNLPLSPFLNLNRHLLATRVQVRLCKQARSEK